MKKILTKVAFRVWACAGIFLKILPMQHYLVRRLHIFPKRNQNCHNSFDKITITHFKGPCFWRYKVHTSLASTYEGHTYIHYITLHTSISKPLLPFQWRSNRESLKIPRFFSHHHNKFSHEGKSYSCSCA
jgi:hypothetical protein